MHGSVLTIIEISLLIFLVAALYSSVGHGGASGYLAVLSLCAFSQSEMKTTALILNILVAGIAAVAFIRAGHFSWRQTWPFLLTSVPAAYVGGRWHLREEVFAVLLGIALLVAAGRLLNLYTPREPTSEPQPIALAGALPIGAGLGLLAGLLGIGGGIFLSPVLLFARWATVKQTAATAAVFIVVNSLAGLSGHLRQNTIHLDVVLPIIIAALCGGLIGSHIGARRTSNLVLQRCLAVVLLLAAGKLLLFLI